MVIYLNICLSNINYADRGYQICVGVGLLFVTFMLSLFNEVK